MAKKHRQIRSPHRRGGFLRGLALGLAVAAGVQLNHAGLPDWMGGQTDDHAATPSRIESPDTNFDFYRLLPKAEVKVDEPTPPGEDPPPARQPAARPKTAANREPVSPPAVASAPATAPGFRVQVGSFREENKADRLRASLSLNGFEPSIHTRNTTDGTWHRVTLGPFRGRKAAVEAKARVLASLGLAGRIMPEER